MPVSFAKAVFSLSQPGKLHLQAAQVLVHPHEPALFLLGQELCRERLRSGFPGGPGACAGGGCAAVFGACSAAGPAASQSSARTAAARTSSCSSAAAWT